MRTKFCSSDYNLASQILSEIMNAQSLAGTASVNSVITGLSDLWAKAIEDETSGIQERLAAVQEAQEKDMKKPEQNLGRFRPTQEGTPEWEYSRLQREEASGVNFYNPRDDD